MTRRLLAALLACACATHVAAAQPEWLAAKIAQLEKLPVADPPREIHQVDYQGRTAYLLSAACCDIPAQLFDADGALICYPYGGFAGGDGQCPGVLPPRGTAPLWRDARTRGAAASR